jgi:hypothetical protein
MSPHKFAELLHAQEAGVAQTGSRAASAI